MARAVALAALADQLSQITPARPSRRRTRVRRWSCRCRGEPAAGVLLRAVPRRAPGERGQRCSRSVRRRCRRSGSRPPPRGSSRRHWPREIPARSRTSRRSAPRTCSPPSRRPGCRRCRRCCAPTLPDLAQQRQFAQLYAQYQGDWAGFWTAVGQARCGRRRAAAVERADPHPDARQRAAGVGPARGRGLATAAASAQDLAARGYYDADKWAPLIGASVPPWIPGADAEEQASQLRATARRAVPHLVSDPVIADQVARGIPVTGTAQTATDVAGFLTANQGQFEIGVEPVEAYMARTGVPAPSADVIAQVNRLQRVSSSLLTTPSMTVLLNHNLASAYAVTRYDAARLHPRLRRQNSAARTPRPPSTRGPGRSSPRR